MTRKAKWKIGAAVIFAALAIMLPEVISAGWHIAHGRTVHYRSWRVVVPFDWFAMQHGEGMTAERMSRFSWRKDPIATFLPMHFGARYKFDHDVFGEAETKTLLAEGYSGGTQREVRVGGEGGYCWTFSATRDPRQLWITCVVPKDLTSVDYIGPQAYANDFFSLLDKIERVTPGS